MPAGTSFHSLWPMPPGNNGWQKSPGVGERISWRVPDGRNLPRGDADTQRMFSVSLSTINSHCLRDRNMKQNMDTKRGAHTMYTR
uniref:Uncharacterized protein n=1 Tax=Globodera rostochiensis TaxID=31243 RepID=A0A914GYU7_GLORO